MKSPELPSPDGSIFTLTAEEQETLRLFWRNLKDYKPFSEMQGKVISFSEKASKHHIKMMYLALKNENKREKELLKYLERSNYWKEGCYGRDNKSYKYYYNAEMMCVIMRVHKNYFITTYSSFNKYVKHEKLHVSPNSKEVERTLDIVNQSHERLK